MASMSGAGLGRGQELGTLSSSPTRIQGSKWLLMTGLDQVKPTVKKPIWGDKGAKYLDHPPLLSHVQQGARSKVEESSLESALMGCWNQWLNPLHQNGDA